MTKRNRNNKRDSRERVKSKSRNKKSTKKGSFSYNRSSDAVKRRAEQQGGSREGFIKEAFKSYRVQDKNHIRILPPTWEDADHFAYDAWVYFGIGPDNSQFLSLSNMKDEEDPILEERKQAEREGDMEYADKLKAKKRPVCWIIDRNNEDEGPQLWAMPWTVDRDIATQMIHHKTGEVIPIDDPYEGYDVYFNREGKGRNTKYVGISVDRDSCPALDNDDDLEELLEFLEENEVPECLLFHDYDHIAKVFDAESARAASSREDEDPEDEAEDLTWDEVHEMRNSKLGKLIDQEDLDVDEDDYADDEELADAICEELGIDAPKKKRRDKKSKKSSKSDRSRFKDMEDEEEEEEEESRKSKRNKRKRR